MKWILVSLLSFLGASPAFARITTVSHVDVGSFVGTWYEIARNPIIFEPKCACARQVLTPQADGTVAVLNSCNKNTVDGPLTTIRGSAQATDNTGSKLSVNFGFPWKGDYWIIAVDPSYRYAVVTDRFGYSLYILSRTPEMDPALYQEALAQAAAQVSTKRLMITPQMGCSYPQD